LPTHQGCAPGQQALLGGHEIAQRRHPELPILAVIPLPVTAIRPIFGQVSHVATRLVDVDAFIQGRRNRLRALWRGKNFWGV
jgi:hypothetical protein